jgi:hypothetical protein
LDFGGGNVASNLDLSTSSLTGTVLTVTSTSAAITNTAVIGEGQELRITGNVTLGHAAGYSYLFLSGPGTFAVEKSGANIYVGNISGGDSANNAILDMSELQFFYASLGSSGTIRIGNYPTSSAPTPTDILVFATNTVVKAGTITVGGGGNERGYKYLYFGSGSNVLHVNTVTLGTAGASGRLLFNTSSGTAKIRGYNGTDSDRADLNMGIVSAGADYNNLMNMSGHSVDLMLDQVIISRYTIGGGTGITDTGTLTFDTGTMDINGIVMGDLRGDSAVTYDKKVVANLNLNGGTVIVNNAILMATNSVTQNRAGHTATATMTVAGGANVAVLNQGSPSGPAIVLAVNTATGASPSANGTLNITNGGVLAVSGNIVDGGNSTAGGLATTTINLSSGSLLMPNYAIVNVDNFTMTNATLAVGVYAGLPVLANRGTGILAPGGTNVVGSTIVSNSYVQASTATLDIDLTSTLSYDRVTVTGAVTLAGTIYVRALPAAVGDFDILTSEVSVDDTSTLDAGAIAAGFKKTLVNDGKTVRIFRHTGTLISFL